MKTELKELSIKDIAMIKSLFTAVFTKEPWNDDWSDEEQGRGLGTQFLAQIGQYVKTKGMKHIFLLTERNMPAYEFYRKNDFNELENNVSLYKEI